MTVLFTRSTCLLILSLLAMPTFGADKSTSQQRFVVSVAHAVRITSEATRATTSGAGNSQSITIQPASDVAIAIGSLLAAESESAANISVIREGHTAKLQFRVSSNGTRTISTGRSAGETREFSQHEIPTLTIAAL